MIRQASEIPNYTVGFSDELLEIFRRFTAEANPAHQLPYLRPGLRVLDFGCGPGTISVGCPRPWCRASCMAWTWRSRRSTFARSLAEPNGLNNAIFHLGDVTDLPFDDGFFDVAQCHNVLMHIPDTAAALAEVKRVLKPGGIIGCREMICRSSFTHPDFDIIRKAWDMFEDLLEADNAHPQMGKDMKQHLLNAGFANIRMTASFDIYSTPADVAFIHRVAQMWFLAPEFMERAIRYGAASRDLCDAIADAYDRWKKHPGVDVRSRLWRSRGQQALPRWEC